ncbi:hypothetical protein GUJ93_ZPchr0014g46910 [Zizania palustris]|uniref:Uncharacterized protein n=1 Tax=Zizania palustris TaxID=103762 RepID=A0A8J5SW86_ZIZPA|nr:hypothetical protein GUJ93_ZPchr0014g46910 [Zizania palustris]
MKMTTLPFQHLQPSTRDVQSCSKLPKPRIALSRPAVHSRPAPGAEAPAACRRSGAPAVCNCLEWSPPSLTAWSLPPFGAAKSAPLPAARSHRLSECPSKGKACIFDLKFIENKNMAYNRGWQSFRLHLVETKYYDGKLSKPTFLMANDQIPLFIFTPTAKL